MRIWDKFLKTFGSGLCPSNVVAATIVTDCVEMPNPNCVEVRIYQIIVLGFYLLVVCLTISNAHVIFEDMCGVAAGTWRRICESGNEGSAPCRISNWVYSGAFPS